jgi:hypothetical protein
MSRIRAQCTTRCVPRRVGHVANGQYVAETDRYCETPGKLSSNCNTFLVNGIGLLPKGRYDGDLWLQPSPEDLSATGRIVTWKQAGDVVVVEGEGFPRLRRIERNQRVPTRVHPE